MLLSKEMMDVRFLPRFTGNPYQDELAKALLAQNVKVGRSVEVEPSFNDFMKTPLPDVLHLHWVYPYILGLHNGSYLTTIANSVSFLSKIIKLRSQGVPVVWTVHNILAHERRHVSIELFVRKTLARICDALIVHCHRAVKEVQNAYWIPDLKIRVIPHGNYINSYPNTISRVHARNMLGLGSEVMYLAFGQIRGYKGLSKIIDAFIALNYTHASQLLIVGKPVDHRCINELQYKCKGHPNIRLILQYVPNDKVQVYMNAADIVVCPYESILTSGMVILAMSFGKIIVAPAMGCIPETVGESGAVLYNPQQRNGLETSMHQALILNDEERSRLQEIVEFTAQRSSWKEVAKTTQKVYEECLSRVL